MGLIDFKIDADHNVIGAIFKAILDIPRWLKSSLVIAIVSAVLYFGCLQGYLYDEQIKEVEMLKKELFDTREKIDHSVLNIDEYNKDYLEIVRELSFIKSMFDLTIGGHNESIEILFDYIEKTHGNTRDLEIIRNSIHRHEQQIQSIYDSYLKHSILNREEYKYLIK